MTAAMENGSVGGGCTKHKRNCAKIVVTKEQDTHAHSPTHLHTHTHTHIQTCREQEQLQDIINVFYPERKN